MKVGHAVRSIEAAASSEWRQPTHVTPAKHRPGLSHRFITLGVRRRNPRVVKRRVLDQPRNIREPSPSTVVVSPPLRSEGSPPAERIRSCSGDELVRHRASMPARCPDAQSAIAVGRAVRCSMPSRSPTAGRRSGTCRYWFRIRQLAKTGIDSRTMRLEVPASIGFASVPSWSRQSGGVGGPLRFCHRRPELAERKC